MVEKGANVKVKTENGEMLHLLLAYGICVNGTNLVTTPLYMTLKSYNSPSIMTPIINQTLIRNNK